MRAGDEWIQVAPVGRVEQFGKTGVACRDVGGDPGSGRPGLRAVANHEGAFVGDKRTRFGLNAIDARKRRGLRDEIADESINVPLHFQQHPFLVVQGESGELVAGRQPPDMRTEAHALHLTAHAQTQAARSGGIRAVAGGEGEAHVHANAQRRASPRRGEAPVRFQANGASDPCPPRSLPTASARRSWD